MPKKKILLHCCCGPCALPLIEELHNITNYEIILFYSNSNIFPKEEYDKRLNALQEIAKIYQLSIISDQYNHKEWLAYLTQNLPQPPSEYEENQLRCLKCFEFRLLRTINNALRSEIKTFATTLSVNRFKNIKYINDYANTLARKNHLEYYQFNLDPYNTYQKERELIQKYNIYSQKYCGCEFSLKT